MPDALQSTHHPEENRVMSPSARYAVPFAWAVCGLTVALAAARLGLAVADPESSDASSAPNVPGGGVPMAAFEAVVLVLIGVIGAVVASRQPRNAIGWILCVVAVSLGFLILGSHVYWSLALPDTGQTSLAQRLVAWSSSWIWIPAVIPALALFPLLFPSGRPMTPRWRWAVWMAIAACPTLFIGMAFEPGKLGEYPIDNPLGAEGALATVVSGIKGISTVLMIGSLFTAALSLPVRFRRARGVERQQLKWVMAAAALSLVVLFFPRDDLVGEDAAFAALLLALLSIAVAVAIAVLRHRLYDIDLVIRRTLVYGALTAMLGATYLALVLLIGLAIGESDAAIAGSTLAVAALFGPARTRIQAGVDRRFYRRRYDAGRTLDSFSARLRDEVDLEALTGDLRRVVSETVQPAHASIWLRPPGAGR